MLKEQDDAARGDRLGVFTDQIDLKSDLQIALICAILCDPKLAKKYHAWFFSHGTPNWGQMWTCCAIMTLSIPIILTCTTDIRAGLLGHLVYLPGVHGAGQR